MEQTNHDLPTSLPSSAAYFSFCAGIGRECTHLPLAGLSSPTFPLPFSTANEPTKAEVVAFSRDTVPLSDCVALHAFAAHRIKELSSVANEAPSLPDAFPAIDVMKRCLSSAMVSAMATQTASMKAVMLAK